MRCCFMLDSRLRGNDKAGDAWAKAHRTDWLDADYCILYTEHIHMARYTFSNMNLCWLASIFILSPSVNLPANSSVASLFSNRCWMVRFSGLAP